MTTILIMIICGITLAGLPPASCPTKSGTNWVRHYVDACPQLVVMANDCTLCHDTITELNAYGLDLAPVGNLPWLIDAVDSDRDGRTNLQEIGECTAPGDRDDHVDTQKFTWRQLKSTWR